MRTLLPVMPGRCCRCCPHLVSLSLLQHHEHCRGFPLETAVLRSQCARLTPSLTQSLQQLQQSMLGQPTPPPLQTQAQVPQQLPVVGERGQPTPLLLLPTQLSLRLPLRLRC